MARPIVTIWCLIFLTAGCSRTERLVEPSPVDLSGAWEEAYTLEVIGVGIPEDPDPAVHEISLLSRIVFEEQVFRITTYRLDAANEIPGACFSGVYSLSGDTLTFLVTAADSSVPPDAHRFHYTVENDRLTLGALPTDVGNGLYVVGLRSLPWQYADASYFVIGVKTCGTFSFVGY